MDGGWRRRVELSLRLNAAFGAMAAALVLLQKTVGLSLPAAAMSLFAAQLAVGKRRYDDATLNWACLSLGVTAAGVVLVDFAGEPAPPPMAAIVGWSALAGLATGALSRLGTWLAVPPPGVAGATRD